MGISKSLPGEEYTTLDGSSILQSYNINITYNGNHSQSPVPACHQCVTSVSHNTAILHCTHTADTSFYTTVNQTPVLGCRQCVM